MKIKNHKKKKKIANSNWRVPP